MESNARVISRLTTSLVYEEGLTDLRLRILLNGTSLISGNHIFITNDEGLDHLLLGRAGTLPAPGPQR